MLSFSPYLLFAGGPLMYFDKATKKNYLIGSILVDKG